jgi:N-acetylglucosamine-6-phosphate deacetylase
MRRMRLRDVDLVPTPRADMAVMVTVAPEMVDPGCIAALCARGVVVAVGHTRASSVDMARAVAEGATCVTHLFNAMDPPLAREPGPVGAALDTGELWASLIADGHHVADALLRLALRAKPDRCLLVSDAMPPVGNDADAFVVAGERISVVDGVCRRGDGVLAGSAISMSTAARYLVAALGVAPPVALRMASADPARVIGADDRLGHIGVGRSADMVVLDPDDLRVVGVISAGGRPVCETASEQA